MHVRLKNERTLHVAGPPQNYLPEKTRAAQRVAVRLCQSLSVSVFDNGLAVVDRPTLQTIGPGTPQTLRVFEFPEVHQLVPCETQYVS